MDALEVRVVETPGTPIAVIRETTTWEAYPALWPALLDEVWATVRARSLPAGRNVMRYLDDTPTVEVGVELEGFEPSGRMVASTLPEGRAAMTVAPATAEGIGAAHDAVVRYCEANGLARRGDRFEVYGHERGDGKTLQLEVYWPLS